MVGPRIGNQFASGLLRSPGRVGRGQQGQVLLLVLVVVALGSLIIPSFLIYTSTMVRVRNADTTQVVARYAADAGITDVVSDLVQGTDVLAEGYSIPNPTVNGYPVTVVISTPSPGTQPAATYQYFDPGASYGLKSLNNQTKYYLTVDNVIAGSRVRVNWAFTPNNQRWRLRLWQGLGPLGAPAPTTIGQDDFESGGWTGGSGWANAWTHSGDSSIVTTDNPYEGSYHLRLRRGNGITTRALNLSGQTNVRLQFWAKAYNFGSGQTATMSVSPDNVTWTEVRVWRQGEDDNVYRFEDIDLSSFSMTSQFWIRFASHMSGTSNYFWVDAIQVVSQAMPPLIAQNSSAKGPGQLLVEGSLITGGQYTLEFLNNSATQFVSAPFNSNADPGYTWVYAQAYKDYIVSSSAGANSVSAYIRQSPGPTNPSTGQSIYIESWSESGG